MKPATNLKTQGEWINWLKFFRNHSYNLTKAENFALLDAIILFSSVAEEFFYRTLEPMCRGLSNKIHSTYNVYYDYKEIASFIHAGIYDYGTWSRLRSYRGECSLFSWIAKCAMQIVCAELDELGYIEKNAELTAKNTSLKLLSMNCKDEVRIVVELLEVPRMRELLMCKYVDSMSDDEIMERLGMSKELFAKTHKVAESMLKERLIETEFLLIRRPDGTVVNLVSKALGDLSGKLRTSSTEESMFAAEKFLADAGKYDGITDVLDQFYPGLPWMEQWMSFVVDRSRELNFTEEDNVVFYERFYNKTSPVELAGRLGRARTWIDNRYSQKCRIVADYIKQWWNVNCR